MEHYAIGIDLGGTNIKAALVERNAGVVVVHRIPTDAEQGADHVLDQLEALCDSLTELPRRGNRPEELRDLGIAQYLELHTGPYRLIYQIIGDDVVVHCVLDGRRDMESLLQRRLLR